MAVNNPEWRDAWPEGPEAELLFRYITHFYRQSIMEALKAPLEGEEDIVPTPELDRRIHAAIAKARRKNLWKKSNAVIRKAAAVAALAVLCILATPTVMFALSPDFRETVVYNYIIDWRQGHTDINIDTDLPAEQTFPQYYVPEFIPEGFILEDYIDIDEFFELYYSNGEQYIYFTTSNILTGSTLDTKTADYDFSHKINGLPTIIQENRGMAMIMWQDDVTAFSVETNLPLDTALEIAGSYMLQENFL